MYIPATVTRHDNILYKPDRAIAYLPVLRVHVLIVPLFVHLRVALGRRLVVALRRVPLRLRPGAGQHRLREHGGSPPLLGHTAHSHTDQGNLTTTVFNWTESKIEENQYWWGYYRIFLMYYTWYSVDVSISAAIA